MIPMETAPVNPFPGLRPFDFEQHHLFFGRQEQVDQLLEVLEAKRFLVVLGPSGSGKSSLVRAGLVPCLYQGRLAAAGSTWQRVIFTPGKRVFDSLGAALKDAGVGNGDVEGLRAGTSGIADLVKAGAGTPNLLLVVDQFEELFRLQGKDEADAAEAARFVDALLTAMRQREAPIYVVLTMRAEFIGHCTALDGLTEAINEVDYLVPRMTRDQLRAAIEEPAVLGGSAISPQLVERLLADICDDADRLPLLQHVLMRTWDYWAANHQRGEPLDIDHYEAVGTVSEALSQHAEEVYAELADDESRRIARLLFRSLAGGAGIFRDGRRPTDLDEIAAIAGLEPDPVKAVVEHFRMAGRWFVMPSPEVPLQGGTVLDIPHESLLRQWPRARSWMEEETQSAHLYTRIANTAALYQEGRAGLYQDPDLELALEWRRQYRPTAAWGRRHDPAFERAMTFLDHSVEERDFRLAKEEERRQRRLRRTRRLALLMGGVSLIFLTGLVIGMNLYFKAEESKKDAFSQRELADEERKEAETQRQLAVEQKQAAEAERERAQEQRLLAQQQQEVAVEERQRADSQRLLAEEQRKFANQERERAEAQRQIAEEQQELADQERERAEAQRQIAVEHRRQANRLHLLSVSRTLAIQAVKIHDREGQDQLAALLAMEAYLLHDRHSAITQDPDIHQALRLALMPFESDSRRVLRGHDDAVRAVAFRPDSDQLLSGGDDGAIRAWDLQLGKATSVWRRQGAVRSLAIRADGLLATGTDQGRVELARLDSDSAPVLVTASGDPSPVPVTSINFSATGDQLVASWLDGRISCWHLQGDTATSLANWRLGSSVDAVAIAADDGLLATGSQDGAIRLWRPDGTPVSPSPSPYQAAIRSLAFSADGRWLVAGAANGDLLLWDRKDLSAAPQVLIGHQSAVRSLVFAPDSRLLTTASLDGTVRLWNVQAPEQEPVLLGHDNWVWSVAINSDGRRIASGGMDRNVHLWTTQTTDLAEALLPCVVRNLTMREWERFVGEGIPYEKIRPDLPGPDQGGPR